VVNADNSKMKVSAVLLLGVVLGGCCMLAAAEEGECIHIATSSDSVSHHKFAFNLPSSSGLCQVRQTEGLCLQLLMIGWKYVHFLKRLVAAAKLGA
jgi:hypothetical protein